MTKKRWIGLAYVLVVMFSFLVVLEQTSNTSAYQSTFNISDNFEGKVSNKIYSDYDQVERNNSIDLIYIPEQKVNVFHLAASSNDMVGAGLGVGAIDHTNISSSSINIVMRTWSDPKDVYTFDRSEYYAHIVNGIRDSWEYASIDLTTLTNHIYIVDMIVEGMIGSTGYDVAQYGYYCGEVGGDPNYCYANLRAMKKGWLKFGFVLDSGEWYDVTNKIMNEGLNYSYNHGGSYLDSEKHFTILQWAISRYQVYKWTGHYPEQFYIMLYTPTDYSTEAVLTFWGEGYILGNIANSFVRTYRTNTFLPLYFEHFANSYYSISTSNMRLWAEYTNKTKYSNNIYNNYYYQQKLSCWFIDSGYCAIAFDDWFLSDVGDGYFTIYFESDYDFNISCFNLEPIVHNFYSDGRLIVNNEAWTGSNAYLKIYSPHEQWVNLSEVTFGKIWQIAQGKYGRVLQEYHTDIPNGEKSYWNSNHVMFSDTKGYEDYANEILQDAWDFEEGDMEEWNTGSSQRYNSITVEDGCLRLEWGHYSGTASFMHISIDRYFPTDYFNYFEIKIKTTSDYPIKIHGLHNGMQYVVIYNQMEDNYITQSWTVVRASIPSGALFNETFLVVITPLDYPNVETFTGEYVYIDYIKLLHYEPNNIFAYDYYQHQGNPCDFAEGEIEGNITNGGLDLLEYWNYGYTKVYTDTSDGNAYLSFLFDSETVINAMQQGYYALQLAFTINTNAHINSKTYFNGIHYVYYDYALSQGYHELFLPILYPENASSFSFYILFGFFGTDITDVEILIDYIRLVKIEADNSYILSATIKPLRYVNSYNFYQYHTLDQSQFWLGIAEIDNIESYIITFNTLTEIDLMVNTNFNYFNGSYNYLKLSTIRELDFNHYINREWCFKLFQFTENQVLYNPISFIIVSSNYQNQQTSSVRAYEGLKSFIMNVSNVLNASIVLESPSIDVFPLRFTAYYFTQSNYINETRVIYNKNHWSKLGEIESYGYWSRLSYSNVRQNLILPAEVEGAVYIVLSEFNIAKTLRNITFYLDKLSVQYNNPPAEFNSWFNNKYLLDAYSYYNWSNLGLDIRPRVRPNFPTGLEIYYYSQSNNVYSRRTFFDYSLRYNDTQNAYFIINQTVFLHFDQDYTIEFVFAGHKESSDFYIILYSYLYVYTGDTLTYYSYNRTSSFNPFYDARFEFSTAVEQVDYNSIAISFTMTNVLTGNITSKAPIYLNVNNGSINCNVPIVSVLTSFTFGGDTYFDGVSTHYLSATSWVSFSIQPDFKHSPTEAPSENPTIPEVPTFDWQHPFKSLWDIIVYVFTSIWELIKSSIKIGLNVADIKLFFNDLLINTKNFFSSALEHMGIVGEALNTIITYFGNVLNRINDIFNTLKDILTGQTSILEGLGDIITDVAALVLNVDSIITFLTSGFETLLDVFVAALQEVFNIELSPEGQTVINLIGDMLTAIANNDWATALETFIDWFSIALYALGNLLLGLMAEIFGLDLRPFWALIYDIYPILVSFTPMAYLYVIMRFVGAASKGDIEELKNEINSMYRFVKTVMDWIIKVVTWLVNAILSVVNIIVPF